jgi:hypothetical protein
MLDIYRPLAADTTSPYAAAELGKLVIVQHVARRATEWLNASAVRRSMVAHFLWRRLAAQYMSYAADVRTRVGTTVADEWKGIDPVRDDSDAERGIDEYLRFYESTIQRASLVVRAEGKPFFHFVQPNQHYRGSKPLSEEE